MINVSIISPELYKNLIWSISGQLSNWEFQSRLNFSPLLLGQKRAGWHMLKFPSIMMLISRHLAFILFTHSLNKYILSIPSVSHTLLVGLPDLSELVVKKSIQKNWNLQITGVSKCSLHLAHPTERNTWFPVSAALLRREPGRDWPKKLPTGRKYLHLSLRLIGILNILTQYQYIKVISVNIICVFYSSVGWKKILAY
jgi:hypothetical protein